MLVLSRAADARGRLPRRVHRDVLHRAAVHRRHVPRGVRRGRRARRCARRSPCAASTARARASGRCEHRRATSTIRDARRPGRAARRRDAVQPGLGHDRLRSSASSCSGPSQHAGGYVAAAYDGEQVVGGSLGFLARHLGEPALHSHVTGILPGVRRTGLGRAMKLHQRAWAAEHGLAWVTWTFDPLVRRNAWFNIGVLGAEVARVPRRLLRSDRRRDQRRRRERPTARRVGRRRRPRRRRRPHRAARRRSRRADARGHRRAAPYRSRRGAGVAPPAARRARRTRSPPAGAVVGVTRDGDYLVVRGAVSGAASASCARSACRSSRRSGPASACRRAGASCSCGPRSTSTARSPRAGASASPATNRRTRRSTSTAPRS